MEKAHKCLKHYILCDPIYMKFKSQQNETIG